LTSEQAASFFASSKIYEELLGQTESPKIGMEQSW